LIHGVAETNAEVKEMEAEWKADKENNETKAAEESTNKESTPESTATET